MKGIKKLILGIIVAIFSLLAECCHLISIVVQAVVYAVTNLHIVLKTACIGLGVFLLVGTIYISEGNIGDSLLTIFGAALILALVYNLAKYAASLFAAVAGIVGSVLDFDRLSWLFSRVMQKAAFAYMDLMEEHATNKDRILLFTVPRIMHLINKLMRSSLGVICLLTYPIICGPVAWITYKYMFIDNGAVGGPVEVILSIGTVIGAAAIAGVLAFCINVSLKGAVEYSYKLDDLFIIFDDLFKCYEATDKETPHRHDSHNDGYYDDYFDNPYMRMLSKATTLSELKKMYYNESKIVHPDMNSKEKEAECTRKQAQLNDAFYEIEKKLKNCVGM